MSGIQISVTIPVLNEEADIQSLLESLNNQTNKNFEVVFVDNGSTDKTKEMILNASKTSNYPIILIDEPKRGVGYARKKGMDEAVRRGVPYLAGTDGDSIVPNDWVERFLVTFEQTRADALFGHTTLNWKQIKDLLGLDFLKEAWLIRNTVLNELFVVARRANFAVTGNMYKKIGGVKQPVHSDGNSKSGEDLLLRDEIVKSGGSITRINSVVMTNPRRILNAIINNSPNDFYVDQIKDSRDLHGLVLGIKNLGEAKVKEFTEALVGRRFKRTILETLHTPNWENAKKFFDPESDNVANDTQKLEADELYRKYKNIFIKNVLSKSKTSP